MAILSEKAYKAKEKVEQLDSKLKDLRNRDFSNISDKLDSDKLSSMVSDVKTKMSTLSDVSDTLKINVSELDNLLSTMGDNKAKGNVEELISSYKEFDTLLEKVKNSLKEASNQQKVGVACLLANYFGIYRLA